METQSATNTRVPPETITKSLRSDSTENSEANADLETNMETQSDP